MLFLIKKDKKNYFIKPDDDVSLTEDSDSPKSFELGDIVSFSSNGENIQGTILNISDDYNELLEKKRQLTGKIIKPEQGCTGDKDPGNENSQINTSAGSKSSNVSKGADRTAQHKKDYKGNGSSKKSESQHERSERDENSETKLAISRIKSSNVSKKTDQDKKDKSNGNGKKPLEKKDMNKMDKDSQIVLSISEKNLKRKPEEESVSKKIIDEIKRRKEENIKRILQYSDDSDSDNSEGEKGDESESENNAVDLESNEEFEGSQKSSTNEKIPSEDEQEKDDEMEVVDLQNQNVIPVIPSGSNNIDYSKMENQIYKNDGSEPMVLLGTCQEIEIYCREVVMDDIERLAHTQSQVCVALIEGVFNKAFIRQATYTGKKSKNVPAEEQRYGCNKSLRTFLLKYGKTFAKNHKLTRTSQAQIEHNCSQKVGDIKRALKNGKTGTKKNY